MGAPRILPDAARFALLAAVFTLAYTQLPLYSSTQNTYFVRGLADAGFGRLGGDWLAHTADPLPVFSALVRLTSAWLSPVLFYVYQGALFGAYLLALLSIASVALGIRPRSRTGWALATALIALSSGLLGKASRAAVGVDVPRLFERGLANQYLLGPVFQPCSFGVLLLAALAAAARGRHALAIAIAAAAATLHPTYLPIAGLLALTLAGVAWRHDRGPRRAIGLALFALATVAPIVAYLVATFPPGHANTEAARILVSVRLPHHAEISEWWGAGSVFQLVLMSAGIALARRTPLFPYLFWPALAAAALTLVQLATGNPLLALAFPWRFSVVLVPVSTTLLLGQVLLEVRDHLPAALRRPNVSAAAIAAALVLLGASGVFGTAYRFRTARDPRLRAIEERVKAVGRAGDLVLVPTDLETFRLASGVPIYVDRKNHPFAPSEVIEWYRRVRLADRVYAADRDSVPHALGALLARDSVTLVVAPPGNTALSQSDRVAPAGGAGGYTLLRVVRGGGAP